VVLERKEEGKKDYKPPGILHLTQSLVPGAEDYIISPGNMELKSTRAVECFARTDLTAVQNYSKQRDKDKTSPNQASNNCFHRISTRTERPGMMSRKIRKFQALCLRSQKQSLRIKNGISNHSQSLKYEIQV
jgi:hypothetical protein